MSKNIILVTTDFTEQANNALKHALSLKNKINGRIVLLHIISSESEIEKAYKKIQSIIDDTEKNYGVKVSNIIREGNIFDDIGKVASELGAKVVIMGTHGVKGMQHIFGSKALKVISMSKVPFISITKAPESSNFGRMVIPFNLEKNPKELLKLTIDVARAFDSEIHVLGFGDKSYEYNKNLSLIRSNLNSNNITFFIEEKKNSSNLDIDVLDYSKKIKADLISISNLQENVFNLFGGFEQNIIANKNGIPVMVVNNNSFGIK